MRRAPLTIAAGFESTPVGLSERVAQAFEQLNRSPEGITGAIESLQKLLDDSKAFLD